MNIFLFLKLFFCLIAFHFRIAFLSLSFFSSLCLVSSLVYLFLYSFSYHSSFPWRLSLPLPLSFPLSLSSFPPSYSFSRLRIVNLEQMLLNPTIPCRISQLRCICPILSPCLHHNHQQQQHILPKANLPLCFSVFFLPSSCLALFPREFGPPFLPRFGLAWAAHRAIGWCKDNDDKGVMLPCCLIVLEAIADRRRQEERKDWYLRRVCVEGREGGGRGIKGHKSMRGAGNRNPIGLQQGHVL